MGPNRFGCVAVKGKPAPERPGDVTMARPRVAILCGDFHSPYKVYFQRMARAFVVSDLVVLNWADGPRVVAGIPVRQIQSRRFDEARSSITRRFLGRAGVPLSNGPGSVSEIRTYADSR